MPKRKAKHLGFTEDDRRERRALVKRLRDNEKLPWKDVAARLDVSVGRARQIYDRATHPTVFDRLTLEEFDALSPAEADRLTHAEVDVIVARRAAHA